MIKIDFIGNKTIDPVDLINEKYKNGQLNRAGLGLNNLEVEVMNVKMPGVIWAEPNIHQFYDAFSEAQDVPLTKYLRSEPVEELLKQCLPYLYEAENWELVNDIEKLLGKK